jgi:fatty-acid desaturase
MIGINLGYHRLLAHRSFSCPQWLEHALAVLGACSAQGGPAWWVAIHRKHHRFADKDLDPHAPARNFLWGHIAWITFQTEDMLRGHTTERYARDLFRDPFYVWLEKSWQRVALVPCILLPAGGLMGGLLAGTNVQAAVQLALSVFVWGVAARTVMSGTSPPSSIRLRTCGAIAATRPQRWQPKQSLRRVFRAWRGMAQQSSRRPAGSHARP